MKGTGIWGWRVQANFPKVNSSSVTSGPWSETASFTRTIREPSNATEEVGQNRLAFSWDRKPGAFNYRVQISANPSFSPTVETATTENPNHSSLLTTSYYTSGGTFYWRVAAADDSTANLGDWTVARSFTLPPMTTTTATLKTFKLTASGYPVKNRYRTIYIYVKDSSTLAAVVGASVRASGAGVVTTTKSTGLSGVAKFYLKATRYPGTVTFTVSKSGFRTASISRSVRLP
jgi:hypothetical protein